MPVDHSDDVALPQAAEPLSRYITGSALLKRRLDQIGLIDAVDGPNLMHALKPGQRLVTLEGAVWRWDGFIAAADAPSAAAQRLAQRNRLSELDEEISRARGERNGWKRDVDALTATLEAARQEERRRREAWRAAQHAIGAAQTEVDRAQAAIGDLTTRQSTLEEARIRLGTSLREAEVQNAQAEQALVAAGTEDEAARAADARQSVLAAARERADQARLKLGSFETAAQMRAGRVSQLERDTQSWGRRRDSAMAQLSTLDQRTAEIRAQLTASSQTPNGFADRRAQLEEQIETATLEHRAAGDRFNVAQSGLREADKALRSASETLANARIELTRIGERGKGLIAQRQQIERQIEKTFDIPVSRTLEASGIRPEEALPSEAATEQKLDRLKAERERLGGVNLSAEKEAIEVQTRLDLMIKDKTDLIEAIAKLRT
ncbi:MAG: chromosome segregation protein SMC, partial [Candidatus Devosia euplotis]|nr:chromosome segregation protein SMC [Candidatus Devosia euplotis]